MPWALVGNIKGVKGEPGESIKGDTGVSGQDGRSVLSITDTDQDGVATVTYSDNTAEQLPLPRGIDGADGASITGLTVTPGDGEGVYALSASTSDGKALPGGSFTAPKGETGPKGADAEPLNLAVTASTLAAGSEATASLSGDYPNLTLALGLPVGAKGETGVGTPGPKGERGDVTVTQQGMVFGEGFPEGKVTANPGTVYTDTAATNGAMQWIKKTGTGATGWDVTVGDTGWRLFHAQNPDGADSGVVSKYTSGWVRRIGVEVHFVAYIGKNTTSVWSNVPNIPTGFKPVSANFRVSATSGGEISHSSALVASSDYVIWNGNGDKSYLGSGDTVGIFYGRGEVMSKALSRGGWVSFRWPTDNAWPSVLPGTPA